MTAILTPAQNLLSAMAGQLTDYSMSEQQASLGLGLVGVGAGSLLLWKLFGKKYNLPPGPRSLPLIGNLHNMPANPRTYLVFDELKKQFGDIVTIYIGPTPVIVLNSADAVRDAFIRDDINFADRPSLNALEVLSKGGQDIVGARFGPRLQQQRKVALYALRKFASGSNLEEHLAQSCDAFSKEIDRKGRFFPFSMAYLVAYNILASMAFGKHCAFDDPFMKKMMGIQLEFEKASQSPITILYMLPFMKYFPSKFMSVMKRFSATFQKYIIENYNEHMENFDKDTLTDFTYLLIHQLKEAERDPNEKNKMKLLTDENFVMTILDLFLAGTETTRQTLAWIWQYLAAFPELQKKAREEVDRVIGMDGKVTVHCREKLPYIDAFLHEVMRIRPVVPRGVPRQTINATKLGGYDIPKGTMIMNNIWSIHHDARAWKNPEAFLPERWLDENGLYVFQQNGFMPFSVGRRSCIGESFAKLELLMLTAMLLQRYTLEPLPGKRINLETLPGNVVRAADQEIVARKRQ